MKKVNIKANTILWLCLSVIALVLIVVCSVIIAKVSSIEEVANVKIQTDLIQEYSAWKAYAIGVLAFSIIVFTIGASISFLGFKSWNYSATL
ncbi:hypothetical protein [Mycoplasmopsis felifaucium]|uniref:Uncharacterized protein n=1 Tax=Mycoplasmopsis felifaucium TaxID=35768 RepID=A0ABZ2RR98_9BACT|nr:hypothetical protein [Mycoplasmopsis felifaucium]